MVKNTHGGNKSKGLARKNTHSVSHDARHIRLPSCEFELLAVVDKLLGNGMFYASTTNGLKLLCRIRNKFKGRSRRSNDVSPGRLVLVGLREWEAPHFKECDLLEVFDDFEIDSIKLLPNIDLSALYRDDSLRFAEYDNIIFDQNTTTTTTTNTDPLHLDLHLDLDFDDI